MRLISFILLMTGLYPFAATANDELATCCGDLESRITELERSAAATGTRLVSLEVSGHVHRSLMFWGDGHERNTYIIDPTNWGSFTQFSGDVEIADKWEAGFLISVEYPIGESISLNQDQASSTALPVAGRSSLYVSSEDWGKLSLGQETEAHDHITEADLSGTGLFAGGAVTDWNGSFFIGGASSRKFVAGDLTWGALSSASIGDGENTRAIRFESAEVNGFTAATSWGEGDVEAISASYAFDNDTIEIEAGAAWAHYGEASRSPCVALEPVADCTTVAGSVSGLHKASGISLSGAGGTIIDDPRVRLPHQTARDYWLYGKLAQQWKITDLGATTTYAEVFNGRHNGQISLEPALNSGLSVAAFSAATTVWGAGLMQSFDDAEMQVYLAWRSYSAAGTAGLGSGGRGEPLRLDDFEAVMAGTRISF